MEGHPEIVAEVTVEGPALEKEIILAISTKRVGRQTQMKEEVEDLLSNFIEDYNGSDYLELP